MLESNKARHSRDDVIAVDDPPMSRPHQAITHIRRAAIHTPRRSERINAAKAFCAVAFGEPQRVQGCEYSAERVTCDPYVAQLILIMTRKLPKEISFAGVESFMKLEATPIDFVDVEIRQPVGEVISASESHDRCCVISREIDG